MSPDTPLRTAADELVDILKREPKLQIEEVAKRLRIPIQSVQSIVDFLVEERVLGIEYKFTTPYIYLNAEHATKPNTEVLQSKERFFEHLRESGVAQDRIGLMWNEYLKQNLPKIKPLFIAKALSRGASKDVAEELWQKYQAYLR